MSYIRNILSAVSTSAILSGFAALPASAQDMQFQLINVSGFTVIEFYTSPVDVGDWEADILGSSVLPSGNKIFVNIADGRTQCDYDLQFVFDDGDVLYDTVDICELGSYTIE